MSSEPTPQELRPTPARMYDYYLGGHHNFQVDRDAADQVIAAFPDAPIAAQANRAFLRRAVKFMLGRGITQFLDLGSGIPTVGNVHEVAQAVRPDARVLYVDIDPVAVAQSHTLLADNDNATVLQADAREPETIINSPEARRMLDFGRPLGVLAVALLHFVPDDELARSTVRGFQAVMQSGSYFALSHGLAEQTATLSSEAIDSASRVYQRATSPVALRSRDQIAALLEGFELVEPGLVYLPLWQPEGPEDILLDDPPRSSVLGAVGRKP